MRRSTPLFCLIALLVGAPSLVFAQGGGKGGIERQSGPGPWHGYDFFGPVACITDENDVEPVWGCYKVLRGGKEPKWWIDFEFGDYESKDDELVNNTTVDLKRWELRATTLVGSTGGIVEVGFGAGAFHYSGEFDSFTKFTLPVRVAAYPLKFCRERCKRWNSVLQVWAKESFLVGRLTGADFGVPASSFNENWEAVSSFGVLIDFRWLAKPKE